MTIQELPDDLQPGDKIGDLLLDKEDFDDDSGALKGRYILQTSYLATLDFRERRYICAVLLLYFFLLNLD